MSSAYGPVSYTHLGARPDSSVGDRAPGSQTAHIWRRAVGPVDGRVYPGGLAVGSTADGAAGFRIGRCGERSLAQPVDCYGPPGADTGGKSLWACLLYTSKQLNMEAREIDCIGITNQRETLVAWDRTTGKPIYPAIVWQCRRTEAYCGQLKERGLTEWFQTKTGLIPDCLLYTSDTAGCA